MVYIPSAMHGIETRLGIACINESPYRARAHAYTRTRTRVRALRSRAEYRLGRTTIERARRNYGKGIRQPARNGRRKR